MKIDNLRLKSRLTGEDSQPFPFQVPCIELMISQPYAMINATQGFGKSVVAVASIQELFNRNEIDLAIIFTPKSIKPDFRKLIESATVLSVSQVEGTKQKRKHEYCKNNQVLVLNYEKMRKSVDFDLLAELVKNKRVVFCLDEVQYVLTENQASAGLDELLQLTRSNIIWPMSASIINGDPLKVWQVYNWATTNPLGTKEEFIKEYAAGVRTAFVGTGHYKKKVTHYEWNLGLLKEIPSIVESLTFTARKTDPGIREFFKGLTFDPVAVEMDQRLREIYDALKDSIQDDETIEYYNAMRATCLHPESHLYTSGKISQELVNLGIDFTSYKNTKLERMMEDIQTIAAEGDKMVVFTHWTNLSLNIIAKALDKAKIKYVTHTGNMSSRRREKSKTQFRLDPLTKVFLTSDSGSHGLNLQQARYVLSYDVPTSYDLLSQRNARIDRADSHLDGLTAKIYYYQDTLEEKIWKVNNHRRRMAAAVHGTIEELGRPEVELPEMESSITKDAASWLIKT